MASYDEIRDQLDTGDIVLFSGKGRLSAGIKWFSGSKWSHVGMVIRLRQESMVLLWESTTLSNLKDAMDGRAKRGVQLVFLSQRLQTYDGDAVVRHLKDVERQSFDAPLAAFRNEVRDRPYEKSKLDLLRAAYDSPLDPWKEDLSSLFCSELVAETYHRLGLLKSEQQGGRPADNYSPRDFSIEAKRPLELMKGRLEAEIPVSYS